MCQKQSNNSKAIDCFIIFPTCLGETTNYFEVGLANLAKPEALTDKSRYSKRLFLSMYV